MFVPDIPNEIPIFTVLQEVLLPGSFMKISFLKESELAVLDFLFKQENKVVGIVPLKEENEAPKENMIGTVATVFGVSSPLPGSKSLFIVLGLNRFIIKSLLSSSPFYKASISLPENVEENIEEETANILNNLKRLLTPAILKISPSIFLQPYFKKLVDTFPSAVIDIFLGAIPATFDEKFDILNTLNITERTLKGIPLILKYLGLDTTSTDLKKVLGKQSGPPSVILKVFRSLSNNRHPHEHEDKELVELQRKIQNAKLPDYALKQVMNDFNRLKRMGHFSPDHSVLHNYLEFVADLPWSVSSQETFNITKAREELDKDHYGMDKLKKRILEYLAVRLLKSDIKGPILCFVGPPGVGKTSIGRSIARILNKKFQRISLGGVNNQSEIRGHRRTYIGALPGRILQVLKNAGTNNPVILLDEIDKLCYSVNGDPRAALLEVLDPEQNSTFTDHYLGMPFDLSQVTFIATANSSKTIPLPLLDRMEVIELSGYTPVEKFQIVTRHLLSKQLDIHGLNSETLQITDEALHNIIMAYTREAGVRALERKLAAVCRSAAVKVAESSCQSLPIIVEKEDLEEILGIAPYNDDEILKTANRPGVALGLAWTSSGGTVMVVEVTRLSGGKGQLILTGCLGNVMKESARIALNWVRSVAQKYGIMEESSDLMADHDLHIHFPFGAVSKDGPSAGVTIACAILSLFTDVPISSGLAMTGEITLQGIVLPVGGIKEKLTAAHRLGLRKVIIPYKSKKELSEVSNNVLENLEIVMVENMADVIENAFDGSLTNRPNDSVLFSKL